MKKDNSLLYLALAILCVWTPMFMAAFDKDKPASSTSLRNSNPEILANWSALETALAQDHEFSTGGTNSGKHEVLTMEEESSAGASSTNELNVQAIDGGSGQPEFAITSEDGDELQMTKDGDLYSSDNLVVVGTSTLGGAVTANGGITLGAGDDLTGSTTSDIDFGSGNFTVAGATGNTAVAGTLGVTGIATLGDTSTLATSGAPAADAQIANKKYVDDSVGTWDPTVATGVVGNSNSSTDSPITFPNGLKLAWGIGKTITANTTTTQAHGLTKCFTAWCVLKSDSTDDWLISPKISAIDDTNITFRNTDGAINMVIDWFALGR